MLSLSFVGYRVKEPMDVDGLGKNCHNTYHGQKSKQWHDSREMPEIDAEVKHGPRSTNHPQSTTHNNNR